MLLQEDSTVLFSKPENKVAANSIEVIVPTPHIIHSATFTIEPTNSFCVFFEVHLSRFLLTV